RCRSQGAAGTLATCGCSNDHEHLHAGRSYGSKRSEQQSRSLSAPSASRLALVAPYGPSKSHKLLFMKEMLVGAVGIELKATLKRRKLVIPLNEKNAKSTGFAQARYTVGTRTPRVADAKGA